jgi:hypothetical protein
MDPKKVQRIIAERGDCIGAELAAQFENLFHVLCLTIKRLSWKQWSTGAKSESTPARIACHIIGPCESYATGMKDSCLSRFGMTSDLADDGIDPILLPKPAEVVAYAEGVSQLVHQWLDKLSNDELLGPTPSPGWAQRGVTYLGRVIYILRHGTYHLGMLRAELDRRGVKYGGVFT